ncbi:hypothetical protein V5O48_006601 [Marasmius crinis-equi]|uniref:F-box domain-containing protein n=1 Tax=Marasmius crinis-equi TaxID=585013 RepID=A0ABR3FJ21_9AGAR
MYSNGNNPRIRRLNELLAAQARISGTSQAVRSYSRRNTLGESNAFSLTAFSQEAPTKIKSAMRSDSPIPLNSAKLKVNGSRSCPSRSRCKIGGGSTDAQRSRVNINSLPFDILGEIFHHWAEGELTLRVRSGTPWILGWVCRHWRQVSLSLTPLWSSLHITDTLVTKYSPNILAVTLERSRSSPLRIVINLHGRKLRWSDSDDDLAGQTTLNPSIMQALVDQLKPTQRRWKSLTLDVGRANRSYVLAVLSSLLPNVSSQSMPHPLPSLTTLTISTADIHIIPGVDPLKLCSCRELIYLAKAPGLQYLSLQNVETISIGTRASLFPPCERLSELCISCIPAIECVNILSSCGAQLHSLVLGAIAQPGTSSYRPIPIPLPRLHRLQVRCRYTSPDELPDEGAIQVWEQLQAPSLSDLSLNHTIVNLSSNPTRLYQLLDRHGATLTTLTLQESHNFIPVAETIFSLLKLVPNITSFTLNGHVLGHFFDYLRNDPRVVPCLTHLGVRFINWLPPPAEITDLARSRAKLRSIRIEIPYAYPYAYGGKKRESVLSQITSALQREGTSPMEVYVVSVRDDTPHQPELEWLEQIRLGKDENIAKNMFSVKRVLEILEGRLAQQNLGCQPRTLDVLREVKERVAALEGTVSA